MVTERQKELRRRRSRRKKLRKLRTRLSTAKNVEEREKIKAKIRRISPWAPLPEK